jgi:hypothetical protein
MPKNEVESSKLSENQSFELRLERRLATLVLGLKFCAKFTKKLNLKKKI